uniref:IS66 family insertion sequence element accessory protein TnpB n=1 Tax=Alloprevotella sp. TaxID=1872471 RepID=UPI004027BC3F
MRNISYLSHISIKWQGLHKSRHLLKMLHWEHGGYVVYYKRLEQGRLTKAFFKQTEHAFMSLS